MQRGPGSTRRCLAFLLLAALLLPGCARFGPKWDHGLQGLTEEEARICQAALQSTFALIEGSTGPLYIRVLGRDPGAHFLDGLPYSEQAVLPASHYAPGHGHLLDVVEMDRTAADRAVVVVDDYADPLRARRLVYRLTRRDDAWEMTERAEVGEVEAP